MKLELSTTKKSLLREPLPAATSVSVAGHVLGASRGNSGSPSVVPLKCMISVLDAVEVFGLRGEQQPLSSGATTSVAGSVSAAPIDVSHRNLNAYVMLHCPAAAPRHNGSGSGGSASIPIADTGSQLQHQVNHQLASSNGDPSVLVLSLLPPSHCMEQQRRHHASCRGGGGRGGGANQRCSLPVSFSRAAALPSGSSGAGDEDRPQASPPPSQRRVLFVEPITRYMAHRGGTTGACGGERDVAAVAAMGRATIDHSPSSPPAPQNDAAPLGIPQVHMDASFRRLVAGALSHEPLQPYPHRNDDDGIGGGGSGGNSIVRPSSSCLSLMVPALAVAFALRHHHAANAGPAAVVCRRLKCAGTTQALAISVDDEENEDRDPPRSVGRTDAVVDVVELLSTRAVQQQIVASVTAGLPAADASPSSLSSAAYQLVRATTLELVSPNTAVVLFERPNCDLTTDDFLRGERQSGAGAATQEGSTNLPSTAAHHRPPSSSLVCACVPVSLIFVPIAELPAVPSSQQQMALRHRAEGGSTGASAPSHRQPLSVAARVRALMVQQQAASVLSSDTTVASMTSTFRFGGAADGQPPSSTNAGRNKGTTPRNLPSVGGIGFSGGAAGSGRQRFDDAGGGAGDVTSYQDLVGSASVEHAVVTQMQRALAVEKRQRNTVEKQQRLALKQRRTDLAQYVASTPTEALDMDVVASLSEKGSDERRCW